MALNHTFENVAKIGFEEAQKDFRASFNALKKHMRIVPNTTANKVIDFVKPINSQSLADAGLKGRGLGVTGGVINTPPTDNKPTNENEVVFLKEHDVAFANGNVDEVDHVYRRNRATPKAVQQGWYRRNSVKEGLQMNLSVPRTDAQVTGKDRAQHIRLIKENMKAWFEINAFSIMLNLMTGTVRENPNIAGFGAEAGAGKLLGFSDKYRNLIYDSFVNTSTVANRKYQAPLTWNSFMYLHADLLNSVMGSETEKSMNANSGVDGAFSGKCIIIISNTAWAMWKDINHEFVGNKDYMGSSMVLGQGEIHEFQKFKFLTVPDGVFQNLTITKVSRDGGVTDNITLDGSGQVSQSSAVMQRTPAGEKDHASHNITFASPIETQMKLSKLVTAEQDKTNNIPGYTDTAGADQAGTKYVNANNLYRAVVFDPKGMNFYEPTALQVKGEAYKDKDKSFEWFYFKQMTLEGLRVWDPLVRELYFTPGIHRDADGAAPEDSPYLWIG